ncbi:MAG: ABC transporter substrate-binding protein [Pedobacter sp.]|nr:ABC transporter substrate-binding protein [Pedobacter sp.]MDQ8054259.1 ABC transporter substrate-binding protein [Pedobacter sp.]
MILRRTVFIVGLFLFSACSPKVNKLNPVGPKSQAPHTELPAKRFTVANISLLIPFKLNQFDLDRVNKAQLEKADMALDFYQGVMLGLDSASATGLNFNVNVFDTRDENGQLATLFKKESIQASNLIIGPVFPEGVKYFSNFSLVHNIPVVSPLAASKPGEFNNPKLISIVNNIDQHGEKIADYIASHFAERAAIVVLINPKKTADEQFAAPIRNRMKTKYPNFVLQEFSNTGEFERRMIKGKKYAVVVCSAEPSFVASSIDKLYKLRNLKSGGYEIDLFGHPNWIKQNYKIEQLQGLGTIISTSYKIDYKSEGVIDFIKKYRAKYHFEPSEYSFKGFDIGFYFARLLAKHGPNFLEYLTKDDYRGLHNRFSFAYHPKYGYFNQELMLLRYQNLSLNLID